MTTGLCEFRCWIGHNGKPRLQIVGDLGVSEYEFADVHALLDAAEIMRRVGNEELRHAPRPDPRKFAV